MADTVNNSPTGADTVREPTRGAVPQGASYNQTGAKRQPFWLDFERDRMLRQAPAPAPRRASDLAVALDATVSSIPDLLERLLEAAMRDDAAATQGALGELTRACTDVPMLCRWLGWQIALDEAPNVVALDDRRPAPVPVFRRPPPLEPTPRRAPCQGRPRPHRAGRPQRW